MPDLRLIIVEDDDNDAELIAETLRAEGYELDWERVDTADRLTAALDRAPPDLIISDYRIPGFGAEPALRVLQSTGLDVPFIVVSGKLGEEAALAIMRAGAHDYVPKDRLFRLDPAIQRELREADSRRERRVAEEALRRSEEGFRLLAEHVQDIIFRCQVVPDLQVAYLSPATARLTGCEPGELLGDPRRFLDHIIDPQERAALDASWRTGKSTSLVLCWQRPDGSMAWLEQRAEGVYAEGDLVAVEGILRDVTERVLAQREHEMLIQQLHQAERLESLGLLAGGMAHDFNNALAVILNSAAFLAEDLAADHPSRADLDRIVNAAERSVALTRRLLVFARRQPASTDVVDLNTIVDDLEEMTRRTIGENIAFSCRTAPVPAWVVLDRSEMEQVLLNMIVNSRAAMPNGGRLSISTDLEDLTQNTMRVLALDGPTRPGQYVRLRVMDTGIGMPPDVVRKAFDPFFTTKPAGEGTGLGLAMAYAVVRQAGGHIDLHSQPNRGTVVTIHLPLATDRMLAGKDALAPPEGGDGETVLVVEDDDAVRQVVVSLLARRNYRVVEAASGTEALARYAEPNIRVDLVLTDLIMPGMSGVRLAERLREMRPDLPIVYMSGYTADYLQAVGDDEAVELLRKPFTEQALLSRLRDVLGRDQPAPPGPSADPGSSPGPRPPPGSDLRAGTPRSAAS